MFGHKSFTLFARAARTVARRVPSSSRRSPAWLAAGTAAVACGAATVAWVSHAPVLAAGDASGETGAPSPSFLPEAPHSEVLRKPFGFEQILRRTVESHQDFPIEGILFHDIFPVFRKPALLHSVVNLLCLHTQSRWGKPDVVVGLDSRGFLFGPMMAANLGCAFVPIRKQGKLPGECIKATYRKEYGTDVFEVQRGAIPAGARVLIVDDLLATGGTMKAAVSLVNAAGGEVLGCMTLIEIAELEGYKNVDAPTFTLLRY